jgi:hypothetical protein
MWLPFSPVETTELRLFRPFADASIGGVSVVSSVRRLGQDDLGDWLAVPRDRDFPSLLGEIEQLTKLVPGLACADDFHLRFS